MKKFKKNTERPSSECTYVDRHYLSCLILYELFIFGFSRFIKISSTSPLEWEAKSARIDSFPSIQDQLKYMNFSYLLNHCRMIHALLKGKYTCSNLFKQQLSLMLAHTRRVLRHDLLKLHACIERSTHRQSDDQVQSGCQVLVAQNCELCFKKGKILDFTI